MGIKMDSNQKEKFKALEWVAMKTQEFGWVAGWIRETNGDKITVRIEKRKINQDPDLRSFIGWEDISPTTVSYFLSSRVCPRIVKMPFKKAKQ